MASAAGLLQMFPRQTQSTLVVAIVKAGRDEEAEQERRRRRARYSSRQPTLTYTPALACRMLNNSSSGRPGSAEMQQVEQPPFSAIVGQELSRRTAARRSDHHEATQARLREDESAHVKLDPSTDHHKRKRVRTVADRLSPANELPQAVGHQHIPHLQPSCKGRPHSSFPSTYSFTCKLLSHSLRRAT